MAAEIADVAAERCLLSLVFKHNEVVYDILSKLQPSDFYNIGNKILIRSIKEALENNELARIDATSVIALLEGKDLLDKVGGAQYVQTLSLLEVSLENLQHYIDRVKFASIRRKVFEAAQKIQEEAVEPSTTEVDKFLAAQEEKLLSISLKEQYSDGITNLVEGIEALPTDKIEENYIVIPTLFPELDKEIRGLESGKLYIIAARSKTFKSTTLLNLAYNIAIKQDQPVLYIDTEMDKLSQQYRLLAIASDVAEKKIRQNLYISPEERKKIAKAKEELSNKRLFHCSMPWFTVEQVIHLVRRYKIKEDIKLLVFDYIKLPNSTDVGLQERQFLGLLTSVLKDLANELKIPVLSAAQLNRQAIGREEYNEGFVAESDRILWFCDYLFFQRLKTEKEIEQAGPGEGNLVIESASNRYGCQYKGWFEIRPSLRLREVRNAWVSAVELEL